MHVSGGRGERLQTSEGDRSRWSESWRHQREHNPVHLGGADLTLRREASSWTPGKVGRSVWNTRKAG